MASRCCYYERGSETKSVCTTDDACPVLIGWTLVGSWGVDDCADCFGPPQDEPPPPPPPLPKERGERERPPTPAEEDAERPIPLDDPEGVMALMRWIKEHWDEVFPNVPLEKFQEYERQFRENMRK